MCLNLFEVPPIRLVTAQSVVLSGKEQPVDWKTFSFWQCYGRDLLLVIFCECLALTVFGEYLTRAVIFVPLEAGIMAPQPRACSLSHVRVGATAAVCLSFWKENCPSHHMPVDVGLLCLRGSPGFS